MKKLLYLLLIISFAASAADFNVDSVQDFRQALIDASNNSEHDTIHVAPGHYDISGGTLLYAPGSGGDFGDDESGLTIQGEDASSTILDGMNLVTPLTIQFIATEFLGPIEISGLEFRNGKGENGGGVFSDKSTTLRDNRFVENKAGGSDGGLVCTSPFGSCGTIGNEFSLNAAGNTGGGALLHSEGNIVVTANRFHNNRAGASGGGLDTWGEFGVLVNSNQFIGNRAVLDGGGSRVSAEHEGVTFYNNVLDSNWSGRQGGGVYVNEAEGTSLINNTLTNNVSGTEGGGAYIFRFGVRIFNNVFWGNQASAFGNDGNDLYANNIFGVSLFNNNFGQNANFESANSPDLVVIDTTNYSQGGNIKSDPLLTADFHLQYGSPAIDAGDNTALRFISFYSLENTDFEGDPRVIDGNGDGNAVVDIGADEDARGDVNKDGCVDRTDADIILHNVRAGSEEPEDDINGDGVINRADARAVVRLFKNPGGASCETVVLDYAKRAGGKNYEEVYGIAVDIAGNSVVTGSFYNTATFGAGEPNETVLISAGSIDIFVAKYVPDGSLAWAKRGGGTSGDLVGHGIAVDAAGNSVVTGSFGDNATFGEGNPNETVLTSVGSSDIFVAKYKPIP
jgi:dockerin type I repeat protein